MGLEHVREWGRTVGCVGSAGHTKTATGASRSAWVLVSAVTVATVFALTRMGGAHVDLVATTCFAAATVLHVLLVRRLFDKGESGREGCFAVLVLCAVHTTAFSIAAFIYGGAGGGGFGVFIFQIGVVVSGLVLTGVILRRARRLSFIPQRVSAVLLVAGIALISGWYLSVESRAGWVKDIAVPYESTPAIPGWEPPVEGDMAGCTYLVFGQDGFAICDQGAPPQHAGNEVEVIRRPDWFGGCGCANMRYWVHAEYDYPGRTMKVYVSEILLGVSILLYIAGIRMAGRHGPRPSEETSTHSLSE